MGRIKKVPEVKQDLIYEISRIVISSSESSDLINQITRTTQRALKASASTLFLLDGEKKYLIFHVVSGQAEKTLSQTKMSVESGIAGWVARNGKPLIINDVAQDRRFYKDIDNITGFTTKAIMCVPLMIHRDILGALQVINKLDGRGFTEDDLETLKAVASTAAMAVENTRLHETVLEGYKDTVKTLAAVIDAKDPYTHGHSERVTQYALLGAIAMSLPLNELQNIEYGGILHDIGKIAVNETILRKPGPLTSDEWDIIRTHPSVGADIISRIPFLKQSRDIILHHHERFDYTGYPDRLGHEDIPIGARLISVADAFDTITTDRSYRRAQSVEHAIEELRKCSGTQFCPVAVEAFISGFNKHR